MGADRVRVWPSSASTASYAVQREGIGRQRDIGQHDHRRETGAVLGGIGGGQRILQMREEDVVPPASA